MRSGISVCLVRWSAPDRFGAFSPRCALLDSLLGAPLPDDWRMYTPVLRAKASEWKALATLSSGVRQRIAPIIEFVPHWKEPGASLSTRKRRAPQTASEYLQRFLESCA